MELSEIVWTDSQPACDNFQVFSHLVANGDSVMLRRILSEGRTKRKAAWIELRGAIQTDGVGARDRLDHSTWR